MKYRSTAYYSNDVFEIKNFNVNQMHELPDASCTSFDVIQSVWPSESKWKNKEREMKFT